MQINIDFKNWKTWAVIAALLLLFIVNWILFIKPKTGASGAAAIDASKDTTKNIVKDSTPNPTPESSVEKNIEKNASTTTNTTKTSSNAENGAGPYVPQKIGSATVSSGQIKTADIVGSR